MTRKVVELPEELREELSEIKMREHISGKGHTNTISFLVRHYNETQSIERILDAKIQELDEKFNDFKEEIKKIIDDQIKEAIKKLFLNITQI